MRARGLTRRVVPAVETELPPLARLRSPGAALFSWRSDDASVGADGLAVDPVAGAAGEERDDRGDVVGRAASLERDGLGRAVEQILALASRNMSVAVPPSSVDPAWSDFSRHARDAAFAHRQDPLT
jgi:hypothetical protein